MAATSKSQVKKIEKSEEHKEQGRKTPFTHLGKWGFHLGTVIIRFLLFLSKFLTIPVFNNPRTSPQDLAEAFITMLCPNGNVLP